MSIVKKLRCTKNFVVIDHYRSGVLVDHEYIQPDDFAARINSYNCGFHNLRHAGALNDGTPIFVEGDLTQFYTMHKIAEIYQHSLTR